MKVHLPNGTVVEPGTKGKSSEVVRWIGIWFDRKLNFNYHVNLKIASGQKAIGAICRLANTTKGLSPSAVRQLYKACVIPICDFGSEIWWKGQKHFETRLQMIQHMALRRILGAFRTTPVKALHNEAGIPPVNVHLTGVQRRYAIRLLTLPE